MIKFSKMHGAGNDFVIVRHNDIENMDRKKLAATMCHRRFGVGADGRMVVNPSNTCDVKMDYYNSDGSIAEMCGNGLRCFSNFVYEKGIIKKSKFSVETLAGVKHVIVNEGRVNDRTVTVNMGAPLVKASEVPVVSDEQRFMAVEHNIVGNVYVLSAIRMDVPHTIVFTDAVDQVDVCGVGPLIETDDLFPQNTNVNFTEVVDRHHLKVDTWERGAGNTWACGTGVCSAVYVANELGYVDEEVNVSVRGGELKITLDNGVIYMEGKAMLICDGEFIENNAEVQL